MNKWKYVEKYFQSSVILQLSVAPTAAVTFVAFGDEIWSPQIHRPKIDASEFPPISQFTAKLIAFYKMGCFHV